MQSVSEQSSEPMSVGGNLTLTIEDLSRGGAGIGKDSSGVVVFVPLTCPGDRVTARVVSIEKHFVKAELVSIEVPSPQRTEPRCAVFGVCGGCQWQHIPYSLQFETKVKGVRRALSRQRLDALSADGLTWDLCPAEQIWEYRSRVQMRGAIERGRPELGFRSSKSLRTVDTERCEIADPKINLAMQELRAKAANDSTWKRPFKVEWTVRPDGQLRALFNAPHGAGGFQQAHLEQNRRLRQWVSERFAGSSRPLLDLYGGSGNLSELLWEKASQTICVDSLVAKTNPNIQWVRSDVLTWLERQADRSYPNAFAILDPPRAGLEKMGKAIVQHLVRLGVQEVVLVSCDVDAFCRDIGNFLAQGFVPDRAGVFDLFPQTVHVESVAFLRYSR